MEVKNSMYKTEITFKDYNDVERTQILYFGFNKLEIIKLQAKKNGGFVEYLNRIAKAKQIEELMEAYEGLIDMSYGVKSDDGTAFVKSPEVLAKFKASPAYSEFLMKLMADEDRDVVKFITGIMPSEYVETVENELKKNKYLFPENSKGNENADNNQN